MAITGVGGCFADTLRCSCRYVALVLDTSGSMNYGGDSLSLSPIQAAVAAALSFVDQMAPQVLEGLHSPMVDCCLPPPALARPRLQDRLTVITFGSTPVEMQPAGGLVRDTYSLLRPQIALLTASGGTGLYYAVALGLQRLSSQRAADMANYTDYNYVLFLQTDGVDDGRGGSAEMAAALPSGEDSSEPHIFAVGFGAAGSCILWESASLI